VLQGSYTYILQNDDGQIQLTHSISAGLDYAAIGPEHAMLHDTGRVQYVSVNDEEALEAFQLISKLEGIIPALESAHAVADAIRVAPTMRPDQIILINLSGRGDKDIFSVASVLGVDL
jgi:tryptophan synthase beta chain